MPSQSFARESETELGRIAEHQLSGLPQRLTACAGIAYGNASQPFYLLHELAEGLCRHVKKCAKNATTEKQKEVPSALAFHRIMTAMIDDYNEILGRELTAENLRQTLECYALERNQGLPALGDLLALRDVLREPDMARGPARELLGLIGRDRAQAERRYRRWREVMADRNRNLLVEFDNRWRTLVGAEPCEDLPFGPPLTEGFRRSPLGDINTLNSVGSL